MIDTLNGVSSTTGKPEQDIDRFLEKVLAAAQPGAVFSAPVVSGAYTVITASEVFAGGGMGFGSGTGPALASAHDGEQGTTGQVTGGSGGGGGGGSHARPIAAILIGPDGVKVQPIADATKIAIAAIGAWASVALMAFRLARRTKHAKEKTRGT